VEVRDDAHGGHQTGRAAVRGARPRLESNGAYPKSDTMCGRYASFLPAEALARLFGPVNPLSNLAPTWNMAPTRDAPVVRLSKDGERHLDALKWGLVPYFTKDLKKARKPINARDDNVAKSGMFREAFANRRCLVPAPAYYEWRDDPDGNPPFAVARIDGDPVVFGGGGSPQMESFSRPSPLSPPMPTASLRGSRSGCR
jgi:putative SOS response-associated peptidase YedK